MMGKGCGSQSESVPSGCQQVRTLAACGVLGAWVVVLFVSGGRTVFGFSNNGWETDHVYACQKRTDGGATRIFTETGVYVRNLAAPGTNWWSLTFAGKGDNDARLFVMRPNNYWNPDDPTDLIVAELDTDGNVIPGQQTTVATLLGLGAGSLGTSIEPCNIRYSPHGGSGSGSLFVGVNDADDWLPFKAYEVDLDLSTILNTYTGPGMKGGGATLAVNWDAPVLYMTSTNLGGATNKGDIIAFNLAGGSTSSYTTLIDGSDYPLPSDWYEPIAVTYRGRNNPENRPTLVITFRNLDDPGNDVYLCSPREHYLDQLDGNGNLALRRRYSGDIDSGVMMNGQLDQLSEAVWWGASYSSGGAMHALRLDDTENRYDVGKYYDAASPGVTGTVPVPPIVCEVAPDPRRVTDAEYVEQLTLCAGTAHMTWIKLQGPATAQVDDTGRVHGWTPAVSDFGSPITFEIEASNVAGSDTESWQVVAFSKADFDQDNDVDQYDFGQFQKCLSGSQQTYDTGCGNADLDKDNDIDVNDFGLLQSCMNGANILPGC